MQTEFQVRMRRLRRLNEISQRELGNEVNVTAAQISNYEIGRPPSPPRARQLQVALNRLINGRIEMDCQSKAQAERQTG